MATPITAPQPSVVTNPTEKAVTVLREALEHQKLCDPDLVVDDVLTYALAYPDESVVDSFASIDIICALDGVFGTTVPKEILTHWSLTTLSGLRRCIQVLERRQSNQQKRAKGPV